jgi:nicotinamide-nucleotide amidase
MTLAPNPDKANKQRKTPQNPESASASLDAAQEKERSLSPEKKEPDLSPKKEPAAMTEPPRAAVIATGSEFALGSSVDTNSAYLSKFLSSMGIRVARHLTVPDDFSLLEEVIRECLHSYDIAIMTGGLGPTEDDFTRIAAAKAYGVPLWYNPDHYHEIRERMARFYPKFPINNHRQAWLPKGSIPISNPFGSAPAFAYRTEDHLSVFLPGVPREAIGLSETIVKDLIKSSFPELSGLIKSRVLIAASLGESRVDELIADLILSSENPSIGLTASLSETKIRITAAASSEAAADKLSEPIIREIIKRLGPNYAGEGEEGIFRELSEKLSLSKKDFFFVENFTLGLFSQKLYAFLPPKSMTGSLILPEGSTFGPEGTLGVGDRAFVCLITTSNPDDPDQPDHPDWIFQGPGKGDKAPLLVNLKEAEPSPKSASGADKLRPAAISENKPRELVAYFYPPKKLKSSELSLAGKIFFQKSPLPLSGPPEVVRERAANLAAYHVLRFLGFLGKNLGGK